MKKLYLNQKEKIKDDNQNYTVGGIFMFRNSCIILALAVVALLSACSTNESTSNAEKESTENKEDKKQEKGVSVDKGLINVEITLPASMFKGDDIDSVIANAKKDGVKEVTKNEDGSLTYKMSKSVHREMMKELEKSIQESIEEMKTSGDYASIKDITHNKSFSEFTLLVDKAAYESSMDGFAAVGLGMSGMIYQIYNGSDKDITKVTLFIKDEATQDTFDEMIYPDDLEEGSK